jgi:hypothetical protein
VARIAAPFLLVLTGEGIDLAVKNVSTPNLNV